MSYSYFGLPDGEYFIQNQQYSTFLGNSGAAVSIADFSATDTQKWKITYITDGYYEISTPDGAKVLTALDNAVSMVTRGSSLSTNQQWFISAGGGGYSFSPRSARYEVSGVDRFYVCLGVSVTSNAQTVGMLTSGNNLTAERLWNLCTDENTVTVNVYYDHAYVIRYGSSTNSANDTANEIIQARINDHIKALQLKYLTEFNILINFSAPQLISCYGCTLPDTTHTATCACKRLCGIGNTLNHHYNIKYIGYELRLKYSLLIAENTALSVCFIGHDYCYFNAQNGGHQTPFKEGGTDIYLNGVAYYVNSEEKSEHDITNIEGLVTIHSFQSEARERSTLIHEFGHLFLAPDHYDDGVLDNRDYCIYGDYKEDENIISNTTICSNCKSIIHQNKSRFEYLKERTSESD